MKLGYMTNAFGPLVGEGGGVTSIKDIRYLTLCDDEAGAEKNHKCGFRYIEVLEGNLTKYGFRTSKCSKTCWPATVPA